MARKTIELKDLAAGQQYAIQVRAVGDGDISSNWSLTLNLTADEDVVAPSAPSNLNLSVDGSSFVGTWSAPTQNEDGSAVEDFKDYRVVVTNLDNSSFVTYYTTAERFEFTSDMNMNAFGTTPSGIAGVPDFICGNIKFDVYTRDLGNNQSTTPATDSLDVTLTCAIDLVDETGDKPLTAQVNWGIPYANPTSVGQCSQVLAYRVSRGTSPGVYDTHKVVNDTVFTTGGLSRGTYYFKVTSYDFFGNTTESNEVSAQVVGFWESEQATPNQPTISNVASSFDGDTQTSDLTFDVTGPATTDAGTYDFHDHYEVRWSTNAAGPFQYQTLEEDNNAATHSVAINGLKPNTTYYYGVKAVSRHGRSGAYQTGSTTTAVDSTPPAAPANPSAQGSLKNITASWDANTEPDVDYYELYASQTSGFTPGAANKIYQGNGTGFAHSVGDAETWYYKVSATDRSGNTSAFSVEFSATSTGAIPEADTTPPSNVIGLGGTTGTYYHGSSERAYVDLTWTAATDNVAVTEYVVGFRESAGTWSELYSGTNALRVSDLVPGTTYEFRVKAADAAGNRSAAWSSTIQRTPTTDSSTVPGDVTLTSVYSPSPGALYVIWTEVVNVPVSHYRVQISSSPTFTTSLEFIAQGGRLVLNENPGGQLYARVKAVDQFGQESAAWSNVLNAVVGKVDEADITDGAVTSVKIVDGAVLEAKLANLAVTSAKIADSAVTTNKILDSAITTLKVANDAISGIKIQTNAITETKIANDSISTPKIQANAVSANEIAANTITAAEIAALTITSNELAANSVVAGKIAADAVTANEIAANAVTASEIAAGAVTADEIAANAVTAVKIAAGSVETDKLAANAVTANKLNVVVGGGNRLSNSSLESDEDANNIPDGYSVYNNGGISVTPSFVAGRVIGNAWRITANATITNTFGIVASGATNYAWEIGKKYVISFYARSSEPAQMGLRWNVAPTTTTTLSNPTLSSTEWKRYAWVVEWTGASTEAAGRFYATIDPQSGPSGTWLEFDDIQVEEGDVLTAYAPKTEEILPGTIVGNMIQANTALVNDLGVQSILTVGSGGAVQSSNFVAGTSGFRLDTDSLEVYGNGTLENVSLVLGGATGLNLNTTTNQLWFGASTFAAASWRVDGTGAMRVGTDDNKFNVLATGELRIGANTTTAPTRITNAGLAEFRNVRILSNTSATPNGTTVLNVGDQFTVVKNTDTTSTVNLTGTFNLAGTSNFTGTVNVNNGSINLTGGDLRVTSGDIESSDTWVYGSGVGFRLINVNAVSKAGVLQAQGAEIDSLTVAGTSTFGGTITVSNGSTVTASNGDWSILGDGSATFANISISGGLIQVDDGVDPVNNFTTIQGGLLSAANADIRGIIKAESGYLQNLDITGLLTASGAVGRVEIDAAGVRLYDALAGGNIKVDLNTTTGNASFEGDVTMTSGTIVNELAVVSGVTLNHGAVVSDSYVGTGQPTGTTERANTAGTWSQASSYLRFSGATSTSIYALSYDSLNGVDNATAKAVVQPPRQQANVEKGVFVKTSFSGSAVTDGILLSLYEEAFSNGAESFVGTRIQVIDGGTAVLDTTFPVGTFESSVTVDVEINVLEDFIVFLVDGAVFYTYEYDTSAFSTTNYSGVYVLNNSGATLTNNNIADSFSGQKLADGQFRADGEGRLWMGERDFADATTKINSAGVIRMESPDGTLNSQHYYGYSQIGNIRISGQSGRITSSAFDGLTTNEIGILNPGTFTPAVKFYGGTIPARWGGIYYKDPGVAVGNSDTYVDIHAFGTSLKLGKYTTQKHHVSLFDNRIHLEQNTSISGNGLVIRPEVNPNAGQPILQVQSSTGTARFEVDHSGVTRVFDNFISEGSITANSNIVIPNTTNIRWTNANGPYGLEFENGVGALYWRTNPNTLGVENSSGGAVMEWDIDDKSTLIHGDLIALGPTKPLRISDGTRFIMSLDFVDSSTDTTIWDFGLVNGNNAQIRYFGTDEMIHWVDSVDEYRFWADGILTKASLRAGAYLTNSDISTKRNIVAKQVRRESVMKLEGREYDVVGKGLHEGKKPARRVGLVAQKVREAFGQDWPGVVGDENDEGLGIDYAQLTVELIEVIQDLVYTIEESGIPMKRYDSVARAARASRV